MLLLLPNGITTFLKKNNTDKFLIIMPNERGQTQGTVHSHCQSSKQEKVADSGGLGEAGELPGEVRKFGVKGMLSVFVGAAYMTHAVF